MKSGGFYPCNLPAKMPNDLRSHGSIFSKTEQNKSTLKVNDTSLQKVCQPKLRKLLTILVGVGHLMIPVHLQTKLWEMFSWQAFGAGLSHLIKVHSETVACFDSIEFS